MKIFYYVLSFLIGISAYMLWNMGSESLVIGFMFWYIALIFFLNDQKKVD